jgi:hypothetical protein
LDASGFFVCRQAGLPQGLKEPFITPEPEIPVYGA